MEYYAVLKKKEILTLVTRCETQGQKSRGRPTGPGSSKRGQGAHLWGERALCLLRDGGWGVDKVTAGEEVNRGLRLTGQHVTVTVLGAVFRSRGHRLRQAVTLQSQLLGAQAEGRGTGIGISPPSPGGTPFSTTPLTPTPWNSVAPTKIKPVYHHPRRSLGRISGTVGAREVGERRGARRKPMCFFSTDP